MQFYSLSKLIWNDESLRTRSVGRSRPEERINAIAIVIKVYDQERAGIDRIYVPANLMMV